MIQAIKHNSRGLLQHWDKFLLLIAVLLLAGSGMRYFHDVAARSGEGSRLLSDLTNRPAQVVGDVDLSAAHALVIQAQNRSVLTVTGRHNLFTPPGSGKRQP